MADRASAPDNELMAVCDRHLQLSCVLCQNEQQMVLSRRLEDVVNLLPSHRSTNSTPRRGSDVRPSLPITDTNRQVLALCQGTSSSGRQPSSFRNRSATQPGTSVSGQLRGADQPTASGYSTECIPGACSATPPRETGVPPIATAITANNTHNLPQEEDGARPRVRGVRRSITSPESLSSVNRMSIASTIQHRAAECGDLTNGDAHNSATGGSSRRTSLIRGLENLIRVTRKKFNRRSRESTDGRWDKPEGSGNSQIDGTNTQRLASGPLASIPFVIPVMNMGPSDTPSKECEDSDGMLMPVPHVRAHTTVDYLHYLVPGLTKVTNCGFYWGVMDRYEAEALLDNKPEGTFLLRDSSQDDFIFSVSFRRYGRSLHARVEQWNHKFSFDAHDSGVYKAKSITTLIEHYKDPQTCMFFEPMLTRPLNRPNAFSLLHLARAVVCDNITYDCIDHLAIPRNLQEYLRYYHYKQKLRVRRHSNFQQARTQPAPSTVRRQP